MKDSPELNTSYFKRIILLAFHTWGIKLLVLMADRIHRSGFPVPFFFFEEAGS